MTNLFSPDDLIHSYTRQQAIEDGVLMDVSETAKEAGVRFPVALTRAVWAQYVEVPDGVDCQDEAGRLWDVLWMFRHGAEGADGDRFEFDLLVRNDNRQADQVTLRAICGPGDDAKPVITIMLLDED